MPGTCCTAASYSETEAHKTIPSTASVPLHRSTPAHSTVSDLAGGAPFTLSGQSGQGSYLQEQPSRVQRCSAYSGLKVLRTMVRARQATEVTEPNRLFEVVSKPGWRPGGVGGGGGYLGGQQVPGGALVQAGQVFRRA